MPPLVPGEAKLREEPILTDAACWKNGCYQKCKQSSQPFLEVVALDLKIMVGRNVRGENACISSFPY
jgi:hypothetical protein